MILPLIAALAFGLGALALLGLFVLGRELLHESIIDAPTVPDAKATREPANRSPSVYSSVIPTD
jgi:hypothetical protein